MYPYLRKEKAESLTKEEIARIFKDVKALFIYRFGTAVTNGTNNIVISAVIGITAVGLASNYLLVISALVAFTAQLMDSFTASVGNLNAVEATEKKETVFNKMFFINTWLYGFCAVGLLLFLNPLIEIWLGKEYLLSNAAVFALALNFYVSNVHFTVYTYLITMGLFVKGRIGPMIEAGLNVVLSIVLGRHFGLKGIFLATSIATILSIGLIDPVLVYKIGFKQNPIKYYIKYYTFTIIFILLYCITKLIVKLISTNGLLGLIIQVSVMTAIFNAFMVLIFHRTKVFKELCSLIRNLLKRNLKL